MAQDNTCSNLVFEFNPNMCPADPLIAPCNRGDSGAISDAINQMYSTMVYGQNKLDAYITFNDERYRTLACKVDSYAFKIDNTSSLARANEANISSLESSKVDRSLFTALQNKVDHLETLNSNLCSKIENLESEQATNILALNCCIANNKLDIKHAGKCNQDLTERVTAHDIKDKHFIITIDGLPESKNLSTTDVLIDRLKKDAQITLSAADFTSIFRVGKPRKAKASPRQIKLKLANEDARSKPLSCRGKLVSTEGSPQIWINEEHPEAYKRRKIMLRELIKHIKGLEGHTASIESGGLRLDGKFYGPDQFNDLPPNCQPHNVQVIDMPHNTTLFAGEWAFMSNMFPCSFEYEHTRFTSSEQCYQFNRARSNNELSKAHRIIISDDPFTCKRIGDSVLESADWDAVKETTMHDINKLKYEQNPHLIDLLLATGDRTLQEATTDPTWGIGVGIRSKAAKENTSKGANLFGKILMQLISELATARSTADTCHSLDSSSQVL